MTKYQDLQRKNNHSYNKKSYINLLELIDRNVGADRNWLFKKMTVKKDVSTETRKC
jgi:hypothetical protein